MSNADDLPSLPDEGEGSMEVDIGPSPSGEREIRYGEAYSPDQMRTYARQAIAAYKADDLRIGEPSFARVIVERDVAREQAVAYKADALRWRFLRDEYQGKGYTQDHGPRPSTAASRIKFALDNYGKRTLDMIQIDLLCHHLGPREEPFWTPDEHFDYARNMDAAIDAAIAASQPAEGKRS